MRFVSCKARHPHPTPLHQVKTVRTREGGYLEPGSVLAKHWTLVCFQVLSVQGSAVAPANGHIIQAGLPIAQKKGTAQKEATASSQHRQ